MVSVTLGALSTEATYVLLPLLPIEASTYLICGLLFTEVASYDTFMALAEGLRNICPRKEQLKVIAFSLRRVLIPPVNKAFVDFELCPVTDKLFGQLRLRLNLSLLWWLF